MNAPRDKEHVVITVLGANRPGILAGITRVIADANVNVLDVSQRIMQDMFALMMVTDLTGASCTFDEFQARMLKTGEELKVKIIVQHEDVFKYMHRL